MHSYVELISRYKPVPGSLPPDKDSVHATLTAVPGRIQPLKSAVESLLNQVDTMHIFLDHFAEIPSFLDHEKVYLTRSQDFGNLGECGKYYWTDDISGYHFICSDQMVYPNDYVKTLKARIEEYGRKVVIGAGGYQLKQPFVSFSASSLQLDETENISSDIRVPVISDLSLAFHSDTIRISRHFFYQPELSAFWFSIAALEQQVPLICCRHKENWLKTAWDSSGTTSGAGNRDDFRSFIVRSYFTEQEEKKTDNPFTINHYFDRIYAMNLDRRPDRWEKVKRIAAKYRINIDRFAAVDGFREPHKAAWEKYAGSGKVTLPEGIEPLVDFTDKFLKYHHYTARIHFLESKLGRKAVQSPGALGYALTYIRILKEAIQNNYRRILVFDDDIVLHKSFNEEFETHARALPEDWKLIMLGAMQHRWEPYITMYKDMFYHCHGSSVASHAVGIDRKVFLQLLYNSEKLDLPIDEGAVFHIQNVYDRQSLIFLPNLAIQDMTGSDINSSAMKREDIESWMKRFRWETGDYDFEAREAQPVRENNNDEIAHVRQEKLNTTTNMLRTNVLFAGHDLKFLSHIIGHFKLKDDYKVDVFTYPSHSLPDTDRLLSELPAYDIVFCEWGLGNIKWFSHNKLPGQKLIVRIHAQEFATDYLSETNWEQVDRIILVSHHMMDKFVKQFPDLQPKCQVIYNLVDTKSLDMEKEDHARYNLGMLGILPKIKSPHLALEILSELRKKDKKYRLYIKSKHPEELEWLWNRPEEQAYYKDFFNMISSLGLEEAVIFEPHGTDVSDWFRHIGFVLSTSENEAFHLAVAEGMAAGTIPVIRDWEGADRLYPGNLIFSNSTQAAAIILKHNDLKTYRDESLSCKEFCTKNFSLDVVLRLYEQVISREIDRKKLRKILNKLIRDNQDILQHENRLLQENNKIRTELSSLTESNNRLKADLASLMQSNSILQSELASNKVANDKLSQEMQQLAGELNSFKESSGILKNELKNLTQELKLTQKRYADMQNSLSWKVGSALIGKPAGLLKKLMKK